MNPGKLADEARRMALARDVARGVISGAELDRALAQTALVPPGGARAAGGAPMREPGDEDEEGAVANTDGLTAVELFLRTETGPVEVSSQEVKRRIAVALAGVRDADGAPVIYMTASGLARIGVNEDGASVIVPIEDGVDMRILVDEHLICGTVKAAKGGAVVKWSNEFATMGQRLTELSRPAAWASVKVKLPTLSTVRSFPFFDAQFRLVNSRGYHAETTCYLDRATDIVRPAAGETPLTVLAEWLVDFVEQSFVAECDATYAVAALLTMLLRPAIDGPTPLFAVLASMPGTGKGKLVQAICRAAMGVTAMGIPLSEDPDRQKSEILTAMRAGRAVGVIDNARQDKPGQVFGGEAIESLLTEPTYGGRLLGTNTHVEYAVKLVLLMTANNPTMTRDMARRTIPVRLTSKKAERAEARSGWQRPDIDRPTGWTMRNRARILGAVVVLVEEWRRRVAAGETWAVWKPGSYEAWAEVVGGICVSSGMPGWGAGIDEFCEATEPEVSAYKAWAESVADLLLATGRRSLYTVDVVATVSGIGYWADKYGQSNGAVSSRDAWKVVKNACGRLWSLTARFAEGAGGFEVVRPAGVLKLKQTKQIGSAQTAVFEWSQT